jgi:hypothetical protein
MKSSQLGSALLVTAVGEKQESKQLANKSSFVTGRFANDACSSIPAKSQQISANRTLLS